MRASADPRSVIAFAVGALVLVVGVALWRKFRGGYDDAADGLAELIVSVTHNPVRTSFGFLLPDGRRVSGDKVKSSMVGEQAFITFEGARYRVLSPRRPDGYYATVRA